MNIEIDFDKKTVIVTTQIGEGFNTTPTNVKKKIDEFFKLEKFAIDTRCQRTKSK